MSRRHREPTLAPRPPEKIDRARAVARFGKLVGRGVTLGFRAWGPVVDAETPEELRREVEHALAAETGRQQPS